MLGFGVLLTYNNHFRKQLIDISRLTNYEQIVWKKKWKVFKTKTANNPQGNYKSRNYLLLLGRKADNEKIYEANCGDAKKIKNNEAKN